MRIPQRLQYNEQRDTFVGEVDLGQDFGTPTKPVLANSLLCFVLTGLSMRIRIPVGYFFTWNCPGQQLFTLMKYVLREVATAGFLVACIVTDNHKINVLALELLCNGKLEHSIKHPQDPVRRLFVAFDQCHLIKNIRSQFLARDIGKNGEVTSSYVKSLYKMQQASVIKPVRFLTRKHVYPSNIEAMNVCTELFRFCHQK
ncbi:hypothetical protein HPB49_024595 [Dermacentor silvarum]|uniref:Uncharacterized protein n=1 Tax=Dermacentor silvarum TaxID=543639 RepID=A0ACB8CID2_DERSI|nr:hypothetical protein HPB49_024595 [Dermacentor silvarum]